MSVQAPNLMILRRELLTWFDPEELGLPPSSEERLKTPYNPSPSIINTITRLSEGIKAAIKAEEEASKAKEREQKELGDHRILPRQIQSLTPKQKQLIQNLGKAKSLQCFGAYAKEHPVQMVGVLSPARAGGCNVAALEARTGRRDFSRADAIGVEVCSVAVMGNGAVMTAECAGHVAVKAGLLSYGPSGVLSGSAFGALWGGAMFAAEVVVVAKNIHAIVTSPDYRLWKDTYTAMMKERSFKQFLEEDLILSRMTCAYSGILPLLPVVDKQGYVYDWDVMTEWANKNNGKRPFLLEPALQLEELTLDQAAFFGIINRIGHLIQAIDREGEIAFADERLDFADNVGFFTDKLEELQRRLIDEMEDEEVAGPPGRVAKLNDNPAKRVDSQKEGDAKKVAEKALGLAAGEAEEDRKVEAEKKEAVEPTYQKKSIKWGHTIKYIDFAEVRRETRMLRWMAPGYAFFPPVQWAVQQLNHKLKIGAGTYFKLRACPLEKYNLRAYANIEEIMNLWVPCI